MEEKLAPEWKKVLAPEFVKPYLIDLLERLRRVPILPQKDILRAFKTTDLDKVKVVIIGQDPYSTPGCANGLAFAVHPEVHPKPPSLTNIFKEVERNTGRFLDYSQSSLLGWAEQGVLLLNTILTVEPGKPLSHAGWGWERFIEEALLALALRPQPLVVMLWGAQAARYEWIFEGHLILKATHPSPNSANMGPVGNRFVGCRHFEKANEYLAERGVTPIDWGKT